MGDSTLWRALGVLLIAFSAFSAAPALAADCTAQEREIADRALFLEPVEQVAIVARHLPWGVPRETSRTTAERLLVQHDYVIRYDSDLRIPLWTAERVDHARLGKATREDCFRRDPRLPEPDASAPSDYDEPIYDQGHMAAFANQSSSEIAGHNSFIMSNMAPQTCGLNRGIWQILEGITRLWAAEHGTVYVFSGSVMDRDGDGVRDDDAAAPRMISRNGRQRVAVPSAFYKIISYRRANGRLASLSIMLPHNDSNPDGPEALRYLQDHVTTVANIERVAGIDIHPEVTRLGQSATFWPFRGRQPRSLCNQNQRPVRRIGERG